MRAGYAECDITPPPGAPMAAFPLGGVQTPAAERQARRSTGAYDPLTLRVLALADGDERCCMVAADLLTWMAEDVDAVRAALAERLGDDAPTLLLCASHSHATPENTGLWGGPGDETTLLRLRGGCVDAVERALTDLDDCRVAIAEHEAPYNFNRRMIDGDGAATMSLEYRPGESEGPCDPTLTLLRFERDRAPSIWWLHWTAHPLTLGPKNSLFSADFVGAMRHDVEAAHPDTRVLFSNGAAGNVHARHCMRADDGALREIGALLAEAVKAAADHARPLGDPRCAVRETTLRFANRVDPERHFDAPVRLLELRDGARTVALPAFLPGEIFVEFQLRYREALPDVAAPLVAYCDRWVGYVPTREAYAEGGYGVDLCTTDQSELSRTMMPPGGGERLLAAALALARGERSADSETT